MGKRWTEHDGVTEWADCRKCGAHIDPVTDAAAPPHAEGWDGGCYICGAGPDDVGLLADDDSEIAVEAERLGLSMYGVRVRGSLTLLQPDDSGVPWDVTVSTTRLVARMRNAAAGVTWSKLALYDPEEADELD
ncbi:MAG: hypothetical protein WC554_11705 [Clostridia bacterium]